MEFLAWPTVTLLVIVFFLILFRRQISELILRVRSVGKEGLSTHAPTKRSIEQQADVPSPKDIESLLQTFDPPVLLNHEKTIISDLRARGLDTDGDTVKVLARHLARTQINLTCEIVYRIIFGSQISLLRRINEASAGLTENDVKQFYEAITEPYRNIFPPDEWESFCQFLLRQGLIFRNLGRFHITDFGKEFLAWIIRAGVSEYKAF